MMRELLCRSHLGAIALAIVVTACAPVPELTWRQREAEAIGRVVDRDRERTFVLTRHSNQSPLYGEGVYAARWTTSSGTYGIQCVDAFTANDRTRPARCELFEHPLSATEARGRAPRAAELVAIAEEIATRLPCSDGDRRIERRLDKAGTPAYVVRACGRRRAFYVDCQTDDPSSAPRHCRVTMTAAPIEIDEASYPAVHVRSCGERGWGTPLFEPDGASNGLTMEEFRDFARRLQNAGAQVKSVGYGPCLCPEGAAAWCARAYVDPKADLEVAAPRIADVLAAPGPKMRVLLGIELQKAPH